MACLDMRHVLLLVLNILKSQTPAMPWEWDSFSIVTDLTWLKFSLLLVLLFVFSAVSIEIPLASTSANMGYVHVQIKNLSPKFPACFLALLFFPQILFWYTYPLIILFFLYYSCMSNVFSSFMFWAKAAMPVLPDLNIFITTSDVEVREGGEEAEAEADIEEGRRQG